MKTALVIDFLVQRGGAEYLLKVISEIYPEAPVYTLVYEQEKTLAYFKTKKIITPKIMRGFVIGRILRRRYKYLLPFYPFLVENFDFRGFDLVISLSFLVSKNIITGPGTRHFCYCMTPARHFWEMPHEYAGYEKRVLLKAALMLVQHWLRVWDAAACHRPDGYIAISGCVMKRIGKRYRAGSALVYPPYDSKKYYYREHMQKEDFFLVSSRLVEYKNIDTVIKAFNANGKKLVITGEGPLEHRLKAMADKNIIFTGYLNEQDLSTAFSKARALVFAQEEDFGISMINALASGTPVIAYAKGASGEIIKEGFSGVFFREKLSPESLLEAVDRFEKTVFDHKAISGSVSYLSENRFRERFLSGLETAAGLLPL